MSGVAVVVFVVARGAAALHRHARLSEIKVRKFITILPLIGSG